jgi:hypothetical protein
VPALQRSKSLLSLHFNFNPGISPTVIELYEEKLKCKLEEHKVKIKVF